MVNWSSKSFDIAWNKEVFLLNAIVMEHFLIEWFIRRGTASLPGQRDEDGQDVGVGKRRWMDRVKRMILAFIYTRHIFRVIIPHPLLIKQSHIPAFSRIKRIWVLSHIAQNFYRRWRDYGTGTTGISLLAGDLLV